MDARIFVRPSLRDVTVAAHRRFESIFATQVTVTPKSSRNESCHEFDGQHEGRSTPYVVARSTSIASTVTAVSPRRWYGVLRSGCYSSTTSV
jgi:hypothetical protein